MVVLVLMVLGEDGSGKDIGVFWVLLMLAEDGCGEDVCVF